MFSFQCSDLRPPPGSTVLITLRVMSSAPNPSPSTASDAGTPACTRPPQTQPRPPWSARVSRAEFRVSRNSHLTSPSAPWLHPAAHGDNAPYLPPCHPLPLALEGRKPIAGGEGAQHREPPETRLTNNASNHMRPGGAREAPVRPLAPPTERGIPIPQQLAKPQPPELPPPLTPISDVFLQLRISPLTTRSGIEIPRSLQRRT